MAGRQILQLKLILLCLLVLCTTSMVFYVGTLSHLETESGSLESLQFQHLLENASDNELPLKLIHKHRRKHLQAMCDDIKKYSKTQGTVSEENKHELDHILVDERHKLLYCYVPKVACTNWKRIFLVLTGQANTTDVLAIPASVAHEKGLLSKLSNYSVADINLFLKTFSKFLFVRHPFERLLSAYHNKLEQRYHSSKYFQTRFGRFIIKNYRINPSNESLIKGDDVTFNEFAAYLVDPKMSFNEHWIPIYNLCHPCLINYDIIGKYETLYEDSDFVLRSAGVHTKFPRLTKTSSTSNKLYKYFNSLSENTINKLYNIYLLDFKLFGYTLNKF